MLHVDATYKVAKNDLELFVVGYSDANAGFHLLATFFSSGKSTSHLAPIFKSMDTLWRRYFNEEIPFTHIMSDADKATGSFCKNYYNDKILLMCQFHLIKAVLVFYFYLMIFLNLC